MVAPPSLARKLGVRLGGAVLLDLGAVPPALRHDLDGLLADALEGAGLARCTGSPAPSGWG